MTFQINKPRMKAGLVVSEREVFEAIKFAFAELKLVTEPGGCVALAALLAGKVQTTGGAVGAILSGGNVESSTFTSALSDQGLFRHKDQN